MHKIEIKKIFNVRDVNEVKRFNDCNENMFKCMKKKCSHMCHRKSQLNISLHI